MATQRNPAQRLRAELARGDLLVCPVISDPLAARLCDECGCMGWPS